MLKSLMKLSDEQFVDELNKAFVRETKKRFILKIPVEFFKDIRCI